LGTAQTAFQDRLTKHLSYKVVLKIKSDHFISGAIKKQSYSHYFPAQGLFVVSSRYFHA
jgi:hypothetical protein